VKKSLSPLIQALISLMLQEGSRALDAALLSQVRTLFTPAKVGLYDLFNAEGRAEFLAESLRGARARDALGISREVHFDVQAARGFTACIKAGRRLVSTSDDRRIRTLYPVYGHTGVTSLLVADYDKRPPYEGQWMSPLLTAYQNQRRLLYTLERDTLTQLLNRQTFDRQVWELIRRAGIAASRAESEPSGVALGRLDIDHFKAVKDRYGQLYGDKLLRFLAQLMNQRFRHSDLTFRYGGEEFCVVLFDVTDDVATMIFDRFRQAVATLSFPQIGQCTVSAGFTLIQPVDQPDDLIDRAARALYFAKQHGRDRVCSHAELMAAGGLSAHTVDRIEPL
jgi:diguanylate cyclase (GGDEF)-like protein